MSQVTTKFITNNAVTNAKEAQIPANSIKGNNTGSTANALDLNVSQVNTMLGTILANGSVAFSADQSMNSHKLTNLSDPSSAQDATTKSYVDTALAALNPAVACYVATTGSNIAGAYLNGVAGIGATLTTTATGVFTLDGVTPPLGARVLIKDQTSGLQNGIYNITTLGSIGVSTVFTRALDYDTPSDVNSAGLIPIINGTLNALSSWQQVATVSAIGTDSLVFAEFTANPSLYLLKANNLSDVASKSASFNNLSPITLLGDLIYGSATNTSSRLAGNTTATKNFLIQTGTGSVSAAPSWGTIVSADIPNNAANTTGTASNITASSNSTLTTLSALSLPVTQLSGTLQAAQFPALTGDITTSAGSLSTTLATVNSNVGSFGSSTSIPSFTVNAKGLVTAASGNAVIAPAGTLTGTTLASNVVSSSLTSVGTITTGTWNGTAITGSFIATNTVANSNLSQMATLTIKGNNTGGTANASDLTVAQVNAILPVFTSSLNGLAPASGGGTTNFLRADGTWTTPTVGTPAFNITSQTTTYSASINDYVLASGSAFAVTLPTAVGQSGKAIVIKKTDSSLTNIITLNTTSSQTIDGFASGVLTLNTQNEDVTVVSDGSNWSVKEHNIAAALTSVSLTITGTTTNPTFGTNTSSLYWQRSGSRVRLHGQFRQTTTGTAGSGLYLITIPSGMTLDTTYITTSTDVTSNGLVTSNVLSMVNGYGYVIDTTGSIQGRLAARMYDTTHIAFYVQANTTNEQWTAGGDVPFNHVLAFEFDVEIPISGWWQ